MIISPSFSYDLSAGARSTPLFSLEFGDVITKTGHCYSIGIPQGVKDVTITAIGRDGQTVTCLFLYRIASLHPPGIISFKPVDLLEIGVNQLLGSCS